MKKIIIVISLLFISLRVFAADANFDSSTGIVLFPRVTVDNSKVFTNLELLLRPDLTWSILGFGTENSTTLEEGDPNYDSSTSIVTFPRVTVDNAIAFSVKLLLRADSTYAILSAEEVSFGLTGNYIGSISSNDKQQFNSTLEGALVQKGNELTGEANITNVFIGGDVVGIVTGTVDGDKVTLSVDMGGSVINLEGIVSDDRKTLSGDYEWDILTFHNTGTWEYILQ